MLFVTAKHPSLPPFCFQVCFAWNERGCYGSLWLVLHRPDGWEEAKEWRNRGKKGEGSHDWGGPGVSALPLAFTCSDLFLLIYFLQVCLDSLTFPSIQQAAKVNKHCRHRNRATVSLS